MKIRTMLVWTYAILVCVLTISVISGFKDDDSTHGDSLDAPSTITKYGETPGFDANSSD